MAIKRTGGVRIGNTRLGEPSPAGEWSSLYDNAVDFDRDEFTALLAQKGYDVTWEKATLCPNRPVGAMASSDHAIDCNICDGSGFLLFEAIDTKMLITGVTLTQSYYGWGRWDMGQVMVTALPEFRLHYWDRLTLKNGVARFHESVRRQPGLDKDRLRYTPLTVDYITWMDRTKALKAFDVAGDVEIEDDYITWLDETERPDTNDNYTVAYTYRPRYTVLDLVHQHRESTIKGVHYEFPVQAVAKLDFLTRDMSKDASPAIQDPNPFPST